MKGIKRRQGRLVAIRDIGTRAELGFIVCYCSPTRGSSYSRMSGALVSLLLATESEPFICVLTRTHMGVQWEIHSGASVPFYFTKQPVLNRSILTQVQAA